MTGSNATDGEFGQLKSYLDNHQSSLLPLVITVSTIGMAVGGGVYTLGRHMANESSAASSLVPPRPRPP